MKFSFKSSPSKPKRANVFLSDFQPTTSTQHDHQTHQGPEQKNSDSIDHVPSPKTAKDSSPIVSEEDPCTIFEHHYAIAIESASNGLFPEAIRAFDMAIRFWCIHLESLQQQHPSHYKAFCFPEINSCDASSHFLNLYDQHKQIRNRKTKKTLWKPPPLHQPPNKKTKSNDEGIDCVEDEEAEIIYFDDIDSDDDQRNGNQDLHTIDDVDSKETEQKIDDIELIEEWKCLVIKHRETGSVMFEYHGQVLMEMDRDFEAIKACQSAILLNDERAINWLTLSRAEMNFGDPFQSLKSISRAIELDYEDNDIIEQYSEVYAVCSKLKEMKQNGRMTDDVLTRRLVQKSKDEIESTSNDEVKKIQKRLQKRGKAKDHIGRIDRKTDSEQIVANYQQMVKMTKSLDLEHK